MDPRRAFGNAGEETAARYLEARGFVVDAVQAKTKFGELDLVCRQGDEVVFVEVKTRRTSTYGYPEEAITPKKFRTLAHAAEAWLQKNGGVERPWRIDVVAIDVSPDGTPTVTHFPGIDSPFGG